MKANPDQIPLWNRHCDGRGDGEGRESITPSPGAASGPLPPHLSPPPPRSYPNGNRGPQRLLPPSLPFSPSAATSSATSSFSSTSSSPFPSTLCALYSPSGSLPKKSEVVSLRTMIASNLKTGYLMNFSSVTLNIPLDTPRVTQRLGSPSSHASISSISSCSLLLCLLIVNVTLMCQLSVSVNCALVPAASGQPVVDSYTTYNETINFTHIAYDPQTDRLYVGASNWLYQFNSSLDLEVSLQTGPVDDSPYCSPSDCTGTEVMATVNINKVLVIDKQSQKVIVCGSVHQGACRRHALQDIAQREELIPLPVAANDENSSTFAFIGPARYFGSQVTPVLYVAATNSRLGPYRDMVPAIGSRSLEPGPRLFSVIEKSFADTARVDISFHMRDYYLVNYVYGFHTNDFVYFVSVQKKSHLRALEEWGYVTRLARVCASDAGYKTYTEVTLQCLGPDGTDYTLLQDATIIRAGSDLANNLRIEYGDKVLVGVFAVSKDHTTRPSSSSAFCIYPLVEIEQRFVENIHICYNGSVLTRNMDYIAGNIQDCPEPGKGGNIISFCSETLKLNGSLAITSTAAITYSNFTLSAVTTVTTGQHTVAFLGTSSGHLKKLLLSKADLAEEFEDLEVDPENAILADMFVDRTQRFLYVASAYKISKVSIERCHHYNNCRECLSARNPYCGWCSLEKRCTIKGECYNSTGSQAPLHSSNYDRSSSSSRWLSLDTLQCIDFQSIRPERLPITSVASVEMVINQLPRLPPNAHYLCVFGEGPPIRAKLTPKGLVCATPPISWRPQITPGTDHIAVDLAVRSTETKTDFLHRPYIFYECSLLKTCMDCVRSQWGCNWCLHENVCSHNTSACTHSAISTKDQGSASSSASSPGSASLINGWQYCPSFSPGEEILLPNGVGKEIALVVKNLPNPNDDFQCVVEIEGNQQRVKARVEENRIVCHETPYAYRTEVGSLQASLTVVWNGDTFIDKTNVTLYKCHLLGSHGGRADCSLCLTRHTKYQCTWCGSGCHYGPACLEKGTTVCPPPRIDWIHPSSGPIEGGTLVVIEGSNLGTSHEEIADKITIGGVPCIPIDYSVSVRVVCQTGAALAPVAADVIVGNKAGFTKAREKFRYLQIELNDSFPKLGPKSGKTRLYLTGSNLNIGSSIEIYLDDLPCEVERSLTSSRQMSCRTTPYPSSTSPTPYTPYAVETLTLRIDGTNLTLPKPFTYVRDPSIIRINPLQSFFSGGRSLLVVGSSFSSIQQPKMGVFNAHSLVNETICTVVNDTALLCPSPSVSEEAENQVRSYVRHVTDDEGDSRGTQRDANFEGNELKLQVGFSMDDVQQVKNLDISYPDTDWDIRYVPDPKFFRFPNKGVKLYKGESLVIEGENLRLAATEAEVNVTIGTRPCNLTSLSMTQLVCLPPEVQPPETDEFGRRTETDLPAVVVRVGNNLRFKLGYLRYEVAPSYEMPPLLIGLISAAGALLMLLTLVLLAVFRHKSSQVEREYKRIQLQMDTLENSVRFECKQAFAELQTDMTDLNNDLRATGAPILDHRNYVMKIFFPGLSENPLSSSYKLLNGHNIYNEQAMVQFQELIDTKAFLLVFINTLENQSSFSIRDRVNVASLLMIILIDKMDYAFDILRELLLRLIAKYANSKHPQLLFRRTEYVVEKMVTNWMALCFYDYIQKEAGKSLFLLFAAIKHQIEKGPIDGVTNDARYSLSEERLLREQIDYSTVTLYVIEEGQTEIFQCKVLDVDTISQVKSKILDLLYKNAPVSQRPSCNDVDLEWRDSPNGTAILSDEDVTSKVTSGWKRLNTLMHYKVKESAVMSLIYKRKESNSFLYETISNSPSSSPNDLHPNSHYSALYYTLTKKSPVNRHSDSNLRLWHLVRAADDSTSKRSKDSTIQTAKAIPEIFLTRLLSTKGTVQKYVDDFFSAVLTVSDRLPPAVKWLFDLLDQAATDHGIVDPEVIHAWKCNSLPLRFWVNLVKNPDYIFDVEKTPAVDACLSVVAQAFMDSCSTSDHILGKESPSSKLLFARDMPSYRRMVSKFYEDVSDLPKVQDDHLNNFMRNISRSYAGEVETRNALRELYVYVARYRKELLDGLYSDVSCQLQNLHLKLESVSYFSEPENVLF